MLHTIPASASPGTTSTTTSSTTSTAPQSSTTSSSTTTTTTTAATTSTVQSSSASTTTAAPAPPTSAQSQQPSSSATNRQKRQANTRAHAAGDPSSTILDYSFSPATITVHVGDTITWTNQGKQPHTATASDGSFDTGTLHTGQSGSHVFTKAGTFSYICSIHPFMHGTVVVQGSSGGSGSTNGSGSTTGGSGSTTGGSGSTTGGSGSTTGGSGSTTGGSGSTTGGSSSAGSPTASSGTTLSSTASPTLANTGLDLLGVLALAFALIGGGILLRSQLSSDA